MKRLIATALIVGLAGLYQACAADAKTNWDKNCAACHGKDGKGQTTMGKKLKVQDYTDAKVQEGMKDEQMIKTITEGIKEGDTDKMKPFGQVFKEDEIKALVKYVRDFKK